MLVAICITTFRRPAGLQTLLFGMNSLFLGTELYFRAVVVDNDPNGSALQLVIEISKDLNYPVEYVLEPNRGLSYARNAALDHALDADALAFIDDDEVPEANWLFELVKAQLSYRADVVMGPVLSRFAEPVSDWIVKGGFFDRPRLATGTVLSEARTGNVLMSSNTLRTTGIRFDPQFALSGGEDADFFCRLSTAGAKIIAVDTAIVHETVPPSRANAIWISLRALRISNADSFRILKESDSIRTRASIFVSGMARWIVGIGLALFTVPFGPVAMVRNLRRIARGAGMLMAAVGLRYNEYSYSGPFTRVSMARTKFLYSSQ
jgi:succinoglycan biosynthesis protein ExoM